MFSSLLSNICLVFHLWKAPPISARFLPYLDWDSVRKWAKTYWQQKRIAWKGCSTCICETKVLLWKNGQTNIDFSIAFTTLSKLVDSSFIEALICQSLAKKRQNEFFWAFWEFPQIWVSQFVFGIHRAQSAILCQFFLVKVHSTKKCS